MVKTVDVVGTVELKYMLNQLFKNYMYAHERKKIKNKNIVDRKV